MKFQEIKLKSSDIQKAVIRGLRHNAWETKISGRSTKELVHVNPKLKKEKHKKRFTNLDKEF